MIGMVEDFGLRPPTARRAAAVLFQRIESISAIQTGDAIPLVP
jgi:hypothetical protein